MDLTILASLLSAIGALLVILLTILLRMTSSFKIEANQRFKEIQECLSDMVNEKDCEKVRISCFNNVKTEIRKQILEFDRTEKRP
jgi:hypothetical protein